MCVKFQLSSLVCVKFRLFSSSSFRDMRGSQIYTMGAAPPARPLAEKCSYLKRVLGPVEMYVEFQLSSSSSFRDMRGPEFTLGIRGSQIYSRGRCAPGTPPSGKIFIPEKSTWSYLKVCKISTFYLS